ncbi:hypothetical protein ENC19_05665 [Verrucosispora sp. CWR15]|uniref:Uncharacterized protein n=1 Tax=Verrucosispora sioxanthis TaxID=2499994 RepID=A0A6M1KT67_9ACTN|nr:hypothetical protein [Verrucosispora sioxanthis]NEE63095.1 hypothetical protein [Verrucosispora sioxanthis]NGM12205.1 hypothetical protein [Verrucosispora sioxanthis]
MRYRPILPAAAGALAAAHVLGILTGVPLLRQAEVAALLLLAAYALTARSPDLPWALPVALTVLVVDAWITMPAEPADREWQVLRPGAVDPTLGFVTGLRLSWAALFLVLILLLTGRWRDARPGRFALAGAVLAATLVVGYAAVRLVEIHFAVRATQSPGPGDTGPSGVATVGAMLAPLALAVGAVVLAALLAGRRHRIAAGGAVLLVLVAVTHLDAALASLSLPSAAGPGVLLTAAFRANASLPASGPAVFAAVELAAYLLLVVGLLGRHSKRAEPVG